jgi:hypothetical protein
MRSGPAFLSRPGHRLISDDITSGCEVLMGRVSFARELFTRLQ